MKTINPLILMLKTAKDFIDYFLNLAENLESKLPHLSNKYDVPSVAQYYRNLGLFSKKDEKLMFQITAANTFKGH